MNKKYSEKHEFKEYEDKLNDEERAWIRQFYGEYYNGGSSQILKSEGAKKEARRNSNGHMKDPLMVGHLYGLGGLENSKVYKVVGKRHTAATETDVKDVYKKKGPSAALNFIVEKMWREFGVSKPTRKHERAMLVALQSLDWVRKQYRRENA